MGGVSGGQPPLQQSAQNGYNDFLGWTKPQTLSGSGPEMGVGMQGGRFQDNYGIDPMGQFNTGSFGSGQPNQPLNGITTPSGVQLRGGTNQMPQPGQTGWQPQPIRGGGK